MSYVVGFFQSRLRFKDPITDESMFLGKGDVIPDEVVRRIPSHALSSLLSLGHIQTYEAFELSRINYDQRHPVHREKHPNDVLKGYEALSKKDLINLCRKRDLAIRGNKQDMIARLEDYDSRLKSEDDGTHTESLSDEHDEPSALVEEKNDSEDELCDEHDEDDSGDDSGDGTIVIKE